MLYSKLGVMIKFSFILKVSSLGHVKMEHILPHRSGRL